MNMPIIQIKNLSITLSGNSILKEISLDINSGEYISIIGPNGAGKTTLVKCIAGIHTGWTGTIITGKTEKLSPKDRAKLQSYVPQAEGRTNPLSVEEFVATGRYPHLSSFTSMKEEDFNAVDSALDKAGIFDLRKRKLSTLSGGERQMAFIAAALAQNTEILLLDEPSTFLDYRHQHAVSSILKSASQDDRKTVIAVHHDINTAASCSHRIIALREGQIVFQGPPQQLLDPDLLKSIYDTDFEITPSPGRPLPLVIAGGAL